MERAEVLVSHLVPSPTRGRSPRASKQPSPVPVPKMSGPAVVATCTGGVNIAVIKYWGKRDEKRILPINSSISATLSQRDLATTTSIVASPEIKSDRLWLNGKEEQEKGNRMMTVLKELRERAGDVKDEKGAIVIPAEQLRTFGIHIVSENNFPTAAGLASSASGFATLVFCLAQVLQVQERFVGELTTIARMGSGSACRSLYGGWVKWNKGVREDGVDSIAHQLNDENHWPDLHVLICVVSDRKKGTSSTSGMETSVKTSELLAHRAKTVVEPRCVEMEQAIAKRDFAKFAELTMRDSNQFHATCLDTYPPIFYLNGVSHRLIALVHALNSGGQTICAYTFDAGPNAVLYFPKVHLATILNALLWFFPPDNDVSLDSYINKPESLHEIGVKSKKHVAKPSEDLIARARFEPEKGALKYLLYTTVGGSPQVKGKAAAKDVSQLPAEAAGLINLNTFGPKQ